ncbi:glutamate receptor [Eurosta solidaginis]|uniref:glutamate receptor n=1 Tax=Eurosta solidaginis TaxID=178769 RepID=UPI003531276F
MLGQIYRLLIFFFYFVFILLTKYYKAQTLQSQTLLKLVTKQDDLIDAKLDIIILRELFLEIDYLNLHLFKAYQYDMTIVQQFVQQSFCPVQLSFGQIGPEFSSNQRHRALVMDSNKLSTNLYKYGTRNGTLINILLDPPNQSELLYLAKRQWNKRGALKIYYIFPNKKNSSKAECVFLNPFPRVSDQNGVMLRLSDIKFEHIFRNLHKYPLRTYIYRSPYADIRVFINDTTRKIVGTIGADGEVTHLLAEKMNFTVELQWPDEDFYGSRTPNGTFNGAIGRIVRFEVDIVMSGFFIKHYLTREVGFSSPVYMDELCCYVKKASRIPESIVPLFAVQSNVLISFITVGLLSPFIWMVFRYLNLKALSNGSTILKLQSVQPRERHRLSQKRKQQYKNIFNDTWVIWVRVNILSYPPFMSERIFVASLCLVSVIYWALFESSLATVYIHPLHYKDINTMKELDDENILIYIKHGAMKDDLFYGHTSKVYQNLEKKLILIRDLEERLVMTMSKKGNFAGVTRASALEIDDIQYLASKQLHKIPECPKNYHIAYVFPIHSPLEKNVNILLLKFVQAGLIDHWIANMKYTAKMGTRNYTGYGAMGNKWKVLTLNDLQLAFYTIMFGSILAALVQLIELFIYYILYKIKRVAV